MTEAKAIYSERVCVKCGSHDVRVQYCPGDASHWGRWAICGKGKEHLCFKCEACQREWEGPCLDAKEAA